MTLSLTFIDDLSKTEGLLWVHASPAFPFHPSRDRLVLVQPRVGEGARNPFLTQSEMEVGKQVSRLCGESHGSTMVRAPECPLHRPLRALGSMECTHSQPIRIWILTLPFAADLSLTLWPLSAPVSSLLKLVFCGVDMKFELLWFYRSDTQRRLQNYLRSKL